MSPTKKSKSQEEKMPVQPEQQDENNDQKKMSASEASAAAAQATAAAYNNYIQNIQNQQKESSLEIATAAVATTNTTEPTKITSSSSTAVASSNNSNNKRDINWNNMYERLLEYKEKYGNCNVPQFYKPDSSLGSWVINQRHRKKNLSPDKISLLDQIDFQWSLRPRVSWDEMYNRLVEYKTKHGHCNVPQRYEHDPRLGRWINTQRKDYNQGSLNLERVAKLEGINFDWFIAQERYDKQWNCMYERLVEYKNKYGSCLVPTQFKQDKQLGLWVAFQRQLYKQKGGNLIFPDRVTRLNDIGFYWNIPKKSASSSGSKSSKAKSTTKSTTVGKSTKTTPSKSTRKTRSTAAKEDAMATTAYGGGDDDGHDNATTDAAATDSSTAEAVSSTGNNDLSPIVVSSVTNTVSI